MEEGFEPFTFGNVGASVSITKNGVTFSKNAVDKIGRPAAVLLWVSRSLCQFAIKPCSINEMNAIPFLVPDSKSPSVRWNNKEFLKLISSLMKWDLKSCGGYKVSGAYNRQDKTLTFDLNNAFPIS